MHYHVWIRINLHTMNRDPRRYRTRSAAYKHIRRHLDGKEAMVLRCDRNLGLSLQQREEAYKQALRVAQEVAFRGLWRAAQTDLEAAAARLTELVVKQSADEEVGDDYVTRRVPGRQQNDRAAPLRVHPRGRGQLARLSLRLSSPRTASRPPERSRLRCTLQPPKLSLSHFCSSPLSKVYPMRVYTAGYTTTRGCRVPTTYSKG